MCKMLDQYADKIKGSFSFFDRMIINGYFRPFLSEKMRSGALYQLNVLNKDFKSYFMNVTDMLIKNIENSASELGRPIKYLPSANVRKEDEAKAFLLSDPVDDLNPISHRFYFVVLFQIFFDGFIVSSG